MQQCLYDANARSMCLIIYIYVLLCVDTISVLVFVLFFFWELDCWIFKEGGGGNELC